MKKVYLCFLMLLVWSITIGQTVTYIPTEENVPNPERGFYKHTEVHSANYSSLNVATLSGYRSAGITQIIRVFYLEDFLNADISSSYLTNMQADFNACRTAGVKMIVRFAYSDNDDASNAGNYNATKSRIISHIQQLSPIVSLNKDVIAVFQAGFVGVWGEWYRTDHFGISGLTVQNWTDRKEVMDSILAHFPISRQVQLRTPKIKRKMYGLDTITIAQAYDYSNISRAAHHNDCFLASSTDYGTYENTSLEYPYLENETKYLAMGGETCNWADSYSNCANALLRLDQFSWDYLNYDYNETVLNNWATNGCINEVRLRLGYRFQLTSTVYDQNSLTVNISNVGFGHLYNFREVYLIYKNVESGIEYPALVDTDARLWLKNTPISITQEVPNLPQGSYSVTISLPDYDMPSNPLYSIRFANANIFNQSKGTNDLGIVVTVNGLGNSDYQESKFSAYITDGILNIDAEFSRYVIFNSIGQKVKTGYEKTSDVSELPSGVYLLKVDDKKAVRIIKR